MQKNIYNQFLHIYKLIETEIPNMKAAPIDANVRWLEEQMDDNDKRTKLYTCRILRNYIQHHSDFQEFINISPGMITFLNGIYIEVKSENVKNTDIMSKMLVADVKDPITDMIKKMDTRKQDYIPVIKNEKIIGIFSDKVMRQMLVKNGKCEKTFDKIEKLLKIPQEVKFENSEDSIEKTLEKIKNGVKIIICTDNGKSTGKILGMISEKELEKILKN